MKLNPPAEAPSVLDEIWLDDTKPPHGPVLWLRSKDGDLIAVPRFRRGVLKKMMKRL